MSIKLIVQIASIVLGVVVVAFTVTKHPIIVGLLVLGAGAYFFARYFLNK